LDSPESEPEPETLVQIGIVPFWTTEDAAVWVRQIGTVPF